MDPTIPLPIDTPGVSCVAGGAAMSSGKKPMKVMVAIDDSDTSYYALKWTVDHLFDESEISETRRVPGDWGKGTIIILHVQQPVRYQLYQTEAQTVTKALEENSAIIIARAMEICRGTSATVEAMIVVGEPKETICDVAEKIHPDLAVVGNRGLSKIKR
ncbi:universal stress protein A-like protein [Aristolochia californica]|uniref:universal stress protein A-like protein n=1 Tax=Aristolochia californica TaxID=171875 RepID=UPI0035E136F9